MSSSCFLIFLSFAQDEAGRCGPYLLCLKYPTAWATPYFFAMADVLIDHLSRAHLMILMHQVAAKLALPLEQTGSSCFPGRHQWCGVSMAQKEAPSYLQPNAQHALPEEIPFYERKYDRWNADLLVENSLRPTSPAQAPMGTLSSPSAPDTTPSASNSPSLAVERPVSPGLESSNRCFTHSAPACWLSAPRTDIAWKC